jgi:hypothetical protein
MSPKMAPFVCSLHRNVFVWNCKGLRMPAMTTVTHAPTAGVGKPSMQEVAEGEARFGAAGSMAI